MKWFLRHWYDVGGVLAVPVLIWALLGSWSTVQFILLLNFVTILLHQLEEYRFPGGEPWILNAVFQPKGGPMDRYPLNQLNAAFINVLAWPFYFTPVFWPDILWLGLAPVLFGMVGQLIIHGVVTNIRLRVWYNPGLAAVVCGHIPLGICYIVTCYRNDTIHWWDWLGAVGYVAFFSGVIMRLIGYGLLSPHDSRHPFSAAEMQRWSPERHLRRAGIVTQTTMQRGNSSRPDYGFTA